MSKAKEQKSSSLSFPMVLLFLIAIAGLAFGVFMLVKQGGETNQNTVSIEMRVGDTKTLETILGTDYTCTITDEDVVSIDKDHVLTALCAGSATISAETADGKRQMFQVTVTGSGTVTAYVETTTTETTTTTTTMETTTTLPDGSVTGIKLTFYSVTLKVGEKRMPIVTMLPTDAIDKSEKWTSSDEKVAKVDWLGNITAVGGGTCTIRVESVNNPNVFAEVEVKVPEETTTTTETTTTMTTTETSSTVSGDASSSTTLTSTVAAGGPTASRSDIVEKNGLTYVQGILIANKTYALPSTYNPGLDAATKAAFDKMSAAAKKEKGYKLTIASGFRSYDNQNNTYTRFVNRDGKAAADRYSARPGHSEHQTGLAIDVNYAGDEFNGSPEAEWLAENCWKYGFIIRYPQGKENITGYKYESWHVRYLGEDLAKKVTDSGKTLEEYLNITSAYQN